MVVIVKCMLLALIVRPQLRLMKIWSVRNNMENFSKDGTNAIESIKRHYKDIYRCNRYGCNIFGNPSSPCNRCRIKRFQIKRKFAIVYNLLQDRYGMYDYFENHKGEEINNGKSI